MSKMKEFNFDERDFIDLIKTLANLTKVLLKSEEQIKQLNKRIESLEKVVDTIWLKKV